MTGIPLFILMLSAFMSVRGNIPELGDINGTISCVDQETEPIYGPWFIKSGIDCDNLYDLIKQFYNAQDDASKCLNSEDSTIINQTPLNQTLFLDCKSWGNEKSSLYRYFSCCDKERVSLLAKSLGMKNCSYEFQPADCDGCQTVSNVLGYLPHPCAEDKYIQCEKVNNAWKGHERPCAPCTLWNQTSLTCERISQSCKVDNIEVNETITQGNDSCQRGANSYRSLSDNSKYTWETPQEDVIMTCPCGTEFSLEECVCVASANNTCKAAKELACLSFDQGWDGFQTTKWIWVSPHGVAIQENGIVGNCGYFDGQSKLEIPYFTNAYGGYPEFAISFWYKREPGNSGEQGLISNTDCSNDESIEVTSSDNGRISGGVRTKMSNGMTKHSGLVADDDSWHHVVLSYNGESVAFYIDNRKSPLNVTACGNLKNSQCPLVIGNKYKDKYFKGYMDEMCIFRSGLSDAQVASLYSLAFEC